MDSHGAKDRIVETYLTTVTFSANFRTAIEAKAQLKDSHRCGKCGKIHEGCVWENLGGCRADGMKELGTNQKGANLSEILAIAFQRNLKTLQF